MAFRFTPTLAFGLGLLPFSFLDLFDRKIDLRYRLPVIQVRDGKCHRSNDHRHEIAEVDQLENKTGKSGPDDLRHRAREAFAFPRLVNARTVLHPLKERHEDRRDEELRQGEQSDDRYQMLRSCGIERSLNEFGHTHVQKERDRGRDRADRDIRRDHQLCERKSLGTQVEAIRQCLDSCKYYCGLAAIEKNAEEDQSVGKADGKLRPRHRQAHSRCDGYREQNEQQIAPADQCRRCSSDRVCYADDTNAYDYFF